MEMTLIITESQRKMILTESIVSNFAESVKNNYEFVKKVIQEASESMGMNLQFAITWGASIGGFIGPINNFLEGKYPNLTDLELSLILTGVIATYYFDNAEMAKQVFEKIKEDGLTAPFKEALRKGKEFKDSFLDFASNCTRKNAVSLTAIGKNYFLIVLFCGTKIHSVNQVYV
jgi:hypothetical protein